MALMQSDADLTVPGRITLADTTEQNAMLRGLEVWWGVWTGVRSDEGARS